MSWPDTPRPRTYVLRLFVAGTTMRSQNAILIIRSVCNEHLPGRFDLEVIDVYTHPEQTRDFQIVATPTLVKVKPEPLRRLVGDFSDRARLMDVLSIDASGAPDEACR